MIRRRSPVTLEQRIARKRMWERLRIGGMIAFIVLAIVWSLQHGWLSLLFR